MYKNKLYYYIGRCPNTNIFNIVWKYGHLYVIVLKRGELDPLETDILDYILTGSLICFIPDDENSFIKISKDDGRHRK